MISGTKSHMLSFAQTEGSFGLSNEIKDTKCTLHVPVVLRKQLSGKYFIFI